MSELRWLETYIFKGRADAHDLAKSFANASAVVRTKFLLWMFTQPPLRDFELCKRVAVLLRDNVPIGTKAWQTVRGNAQYDYEMNDRRSDKHFAAMAAYEPFKMETVIRGAAGIVIYGAPTTAQADADTDVLNARITEKIAELLKGTLT